jgi:hypothetical protein
LNKVDVGQPLHALGPEAAFAFDIPGIQINLEHAPSIARGRGHETNPAKTTRNKIRNGRDAAQRRNQRLTQVLSDPGNTSTQPL